MSVQTYFAISIFIFWCGKWIVHLLAICYGLFKLHKKTSNLPRETPLPSVSILKPLMGIDPNLTINLETFFTMNYPNYEIIFCIEDKNDPAIEIVENLRKKYPKIESYLFLGGSNVGVNPKINNMHQGYLAAQYELIWISDSGIKTKEDTLMDMVQHMTEKVGLVHQLPFTCDREGFAATYEKIFFGTIQSRIYLCSDLLGINCHTGMSCLMRKSIVDELGGLSKFGCYLAEDHFIAKAFKDRGLKMRISSQSALQNCGICDISNFQARLCRWAKLRVAMLPATILFEPISECLLLGIIGAISVQYLFNFDFLVIYLIHILLWFLSDWTLLSIVQNGTLPFNKFEFVVGWLFRELSAPILFSYAILYPTIQWRTRLYKLNWGGIAYELIDNNNINNKIIINDIIDNNTIDETELYQITTIQDQNLDNNNFNEQNINTNNIILSSTIQQTTSLPTQMLSNNNNNKNLPIYISSNNMPSILSTLYNGQLNKNQPNIQTNKITSSISSSSSSDKECMVMFSNIKDKS